MTVIFVVANEEYLLANWQAVSSKYVLDLLDTYDSDDVTVTIPAVYSDVFDIYATFLSTKIKQRSYTDVAAADAISSLDLPTDLYKQERQAKELRKTKLTSTLTDFQFNNLAELLVKCFELETFLADEDFYKWLMQQVYGIWDEMTEDRMMIDGQLRSYVGQLADKRLFYMHVPFPLVPVEYQGKPSFRRDWLAVNSGATSSGATKPVEVLDHGMVHKYSTSISVYPGSQQIRELTVIEVAHLSQSTTYYRRFRYIWKWDKDGNLLEHSKQLDEPATSISNRLPPPKVGLLRGGKGMTVNYTARSVTAPGYNLKVDEVGIPLHIAKKTTLDPRVISATKELSQNLNR